MRSEIIERFIKLFEEEVANTKEQMVESDLGYFNDLKGFECQCGATKMVFFPDDDDSFVIKVPFFSMDGGMEEDYCEKYSCLIDYVDDHKDEPDVECDACPSCFNCPYYNCREVEFGLKGVPDNYLAEEVRKYEEAEKAGVEKFFLQNTIVGMINHEIPVYIQERANTQIKLGQDFKTAPASKVPGLGPVPFYLLLTTYDADEIEVL